MNPAFHHFSSFFIIFHQSITRDPEFSQTCGFLQKLRVHKAYRFSEKKLYINELVFPQNPKNLIFSLILLKICSMWVFQKNPKSSLIFLYHFTIPCKKLEHSDHRKYYKLSGRGGLTTIFSDIGSTEVENWTSCRTDSTSVLSNYQTFQLL